ncbi:MAG: hypothetical protein HY744_27580 [Deltaproteobacteria bacterium]|nr:hypothetical protein [Deltaproteobacteria bacterium]
MTLLPTSIASPAGGQVRVFRSPEAALSHVRDHLLTAPECEGWALVAAGYAAIVDPFDAEARWRYCLEMHSSAGNSCADLYGLYASAIATALGDAWRLKWWVEVDRPAARVAAALGTAGLLVMLEARDGQPPCVLTAYLPGLGAAERVRAWASRGADAGPCDLLREGGTGMRRRRGEDGALGRRERLAQERREGAWGPERRLFHRVFRPAVQFVRRSHYLASDPLTGLRHQGRGEYALLKGKLPSTRSLTFEAWCTLRGSHEEAVHE